MTSGVPAQSYDLDPFFRNVMEFYQERKLKIPAELETFYKATLGRQKLPGVFVLPVPATATTEEGSKNKKQKTTASWHDDVNAKLKLTLLMKNTSWLSEFRPKKVTFERWAHIISWILNKGDKVVADNLDSSLHRDEKAIEAATTAVQSNLGEFNTQVKLLEAEQVTETDLRLANIDAQLSSLKTRVDAARLLSEEEPANETVREEFVEASAELKELERERTLYAGTRLYNTTVPFPTLKFPLDTRELEGKRAEARAAVEERETRIQALRTKLQAAEFERVQRVTEAVKRAQEVLIRKRDFTGIPIDAQAYRIPVAEKFVQAVLEARIIATYSSDEKTAEAMAALSAVRSSEMPPSELGPVTNILIRLRQLRSEVEEPSAVAPRDTTVAAYNDYAGILTVSLVLQAIDQPAVPKWNSGTVSLRDVIVSQVMEQFSAYLQRAIQGVLKAVDARFDSLVNSAEDCKKASDFMEGLDRDVNDAQARVNDFNDPEKKIGDDADREAAKIELTAAQNAKSVYLRDNAATLAKCRDEYGHIMKAELSGTVLHFLKDNRDSNIQELAEIDEDGFLSLLQIVVTASRLEHAAEKIATIFNNAFPVFQAVVMKQTLAAFADFDASNPFNNAAQTVDRLLALFKSFERNEMMNTLSDHVWPTITERDQQDFVEQLKQARAIFSDKNTSIAAKGQWVASIAPRLAETQVPTGSLLPELFLRTAQPMADVHSLFGIEGYGESADWSFFRRKYQEAMNRNLTGADDPQRKIANTRGICSALVGELVSGVFNVYLLPLSL